MVVKVMNEQRLSHLFGLRPFFVQKAPSVVAYTVGGRLHVLSLIPGRVKPMTYKIDACHYLACCLTLSYLARCLTLKLHSPMVCDFSHRF